MRQTILHSLRPLLFLLLAAVTLAACEQNDTPANDNPPATTAFKIQVGDFPAFQEDLTTRAVGTFDPGKSSWETGDVLLMKIEFYEGFDGEYCVGEILKSYYYKLTYTGTDWIPTQKNGTQYGPATPINAPSYKAGVTIRVVYASSFDWQDNTDLLYEMPRRVAGNPGTDDFISVSEDKSFLSLADNGGTLSLNISFPPYRSYTRLRVATGGRTERVILTCPGFEPSGEGLETSYTSIPDAKGNAYFYGVWRTDSEMTVEVESNGERSVVSRIASTGGLAPGSVFSPGRAYVLDAIPSHD